MARKERSLRHGYGYIEQRVNKDGSHTAQARWKEGAHYRAKSFRAETATAAYDLAEDHLTTIGRLRRDGSYTPASRIAVTEVMHDYLTRGKRKWSTNTLSTYAVVNQRHISPYIGSVRMVDLTPQRVQALVDTLEAKGLSASSIENIRVVLNGACKDAMRLGIIHHNPVSGVSIPSRQRFPYKVWTAEHVQAVLRACEDDLRMLTVYTLALTTAARPGEIRALMWSDIDFEKKRMRVQRTITRDTRGRQIIGVTTKTRRTRSVALPEGTISVLKRWRQDQLQRRVAARQWKDLDLVLDRGDGNLLPQNTLARLHQDVCVRANVPLIRVHDLRHTAATLLVNAGTHIKVVSDILGHASVTTTMDIYSHPDESIQREATSLLDEILKRRA